MSNIYTVIELMLKDAPLTTDERENLIHLRNTRSATLQNISEMYLPIGVLIKNEEIGRHLACNKIIIDNFKN